MRKQRWYRRRETTPEKQLGARSGPAAEAASQLPPRGDANPHGDPQDINRDPSMPQLWDKFAEAGALEKQRDARMAAKGYVYDRNRGWVRRRQRHRKSHATEVFPEQNATAVQ